MVRRDPYPSTPHHRWWSCVGRGFIRASYIARDDVCDAEDVSPRDRSTSIQFRSRVNGPGAEISGNIHVRLHMTGPGAEISAPYAGPPIRRMDSIVGMTTVGGGI